MAAGNRTARGTEARRQRGRTPYQHLWPLYEPAALALQTAWEANPEIDRLFEIACADTQTALALLGTDLENSAKKVSRQSIADMANLLRADPHVEHHFGEYLVPWIRRAVTPPEHRAPLLDPWSGPRLKALLPAQKSRYEVYDGKRVMVRNGATPAEIKRLLPYELYEAELTSGQPAKRQGKSEGDGAIWAGGNADFLESLWTTLETLCENTGTIYGHNPVSARFCELMRGAPSPRTQHKWLNRVGLKPNDIKSGKVSRANYVQFVAKKLS